MEKGPIDQTYPKAPQDLPPPYYPDLSQEGQQQGPPIGFSGQESHHQQNPTIVQIVQILNLGPHTTRMPCPHCGADIQTRVRHNPGRMTHLAALVLCLLCWPCVCVPYCMDDCMDADHECPNCDKLIGTYKR